MSDRPRNSLPSSLRAVGRVLTTPIRWVRESESDVDGCYPERTRRSGEQVATHGSVITNLTGLGNG